MDQNSLTKRHILRFRQANADTFEAIRIGKKKIETRAATVKNRKINKGDELEFRCGSESFVKIVKKAEHFSSLDALLKKHNFNHVNPFVDSAEALKKKIYGFPGYRQKIATYGIMAFSL